MPIAIVVGQSDGWLDPQIIRWSASSSQYKIVQERLAEQNLVVQELRRENAKLLAVTKDKDAELAKLQQVSRFAYAWLCICMPKTQAPK